MITRHHQTGETLSSAAYSTCETYRYALTRTWNPSGKRLVYVMLNPSKATEQHNDPTVERCERRARALQFGAFRVVNLFALRETNPAIMRKSPHPIGPENDMALITGAKWADMILCAWGVHGTHLHRNVEVTKHFLSTGKPLYTLGLSKAGHPKHPLYISYAQTPQPWEPVL
jgi:hypothetical protein